MLGTDRLNLALALVATVAVGCGSSGDTKGSGGQGGSTASTTTTSTSSSTTSSSTSSSSETASCPSPEGTTLAVTKLYFGEGNSGEWKKVGFNVDGKISTISSTDLCLPSSGATVLTPYPDGEQGIDNSFGKNLLPTIISLYPTWVTDINNRVQNGDYTVLMKMECLGPSGDLPLFPTKLFGGTTLGTKPKFDGTDVWPVAPELLSDPKDPLSSTVIFDQCSVKGTAFDAGTNGTFILTVPIKTQTDSTSIKLTLYAAHMKMTLGADRKSATAGMIGGVLNTEEFVAEIKKVGSLLGLCGSSSFDDLVTQVRQASDIMSDGSQDPTKTCNGISMGLGFEMKAVQLGDVGPAAPQGTACQ